MNGRNTPSDGGNVVDFASRTGRTGFTLAPDTPIIPVIPPPPASPPASSGETRRRSPLDVITALPDPALLQPPIPAPVPAPGKVPATFRSQPAPDMAGPRLGALSLAACLAVAVAALRGTHTVLSTWWEQRQARQAETAPLREARLKHQVAMQQIADKGAQQQAKTNRRVPSSSEFGRKSLSSRSSGGSGRSGGRNSTSRSSGLGSGSGGSKKSGGSGKSSGGSSTGSGAGGRSDGRGLFAGGQGRKPANRVKKNQTPSTGKQRKESAGTPGAYKNRRSTSGGGQGARKPRHADSAGGRSSLTAATGKAMQKAAGQRLKKRRTSSDTPAVWSADTKPGISSAKTPKKTKKGKNADGVQKTANTPKTPNAAAAKDLQAGKGGQASGKKTSRLRAALRKKTRKNTTPTGTGKQHTPKQRTKKTRPAGRTTLTASLRHAAHKAAARRLKQRRTHPGTPPIWTTPRPQQNTTSTGSSASDGSGSHTTTDGTWAGSTRRSTPFQNAAQATTDTTITVEPENPRHRTQARHPLALPAAASTKEPTAMPPSQPARPDPRITKARHQAARTAATTLSTGRQMDAQHETEITLDDALDAYGEFKDDGFKTHDQCLKLAGRARSLRDTLAVFAEELAVNHNLIGAMFSGAMARLAESMDLVARMADEMQISSLEAAEMSEAADNDLNDAYRPYSTATADAGLSTPSAPIHNQS